MAYSIFFLQGQTADPEISFGNPAPRPLELCEGCDPALVPLGGATYRITPRNLYLQHEWGVIRVLGLGGGATLAATGGGCPLLTP